jgi:hypothetical protein
MRQLPKVGELAHLQVDQLRERQVVLKFQLQQFDLRHFRLLP